MEKEELVTCNCDKCIAPFEVVNVSLGSRDYGKFVYCQRAIQDDIDDGFIVEIINTTHP